MPSFNTERVSEKTCWLCLHIWQVCHVGLYSPIPGRIIAQAKAEPWNGSLLYCPRSWIWVDFVQKPESYEPSTASRRLGYGLLFLLEVQTLYMNMRAHVSHKHGRSLERLSLAFAILATIPTLSIYKSVDWLAGCKYGTGREREKERIQVRYESSMGYSFFPRIFFSLRGTAATLITMDEFHIYRDSSEWWTDLHRRQNERQ